MQLLLLPDCSILIYDGNITDDNEEDVFTYAKKVNESGTKIDVFFNSPRDADHRRCKQRLTQFRPDLKGRSVSTPNSGRPK